MCELGNIYLSDEGRFNYDRKNTIDFDYGFFIARVVNSNKYVFAGFYYDILMFMIYRSKGQLVLKPSKKSFTLFRFKDEDDFLSRIKVIKTFDIASFLLSAEGIDKIFSYSSDNSLELLPV